MGRLNQRRQSTALATSHRRAQLAQTLDTLVTYAAMTPRHMKSRSLTSRKSVKFWTVQMK